jgi:hypothetical protein
MPVTARAAGISILPIHTSESVKGELHDVVTQASPPRHAFRPEKFGAL